MTVVIHVIAYIMQNIHQNISNINYITSDINIHFSLFI